MNKENYELIEGIKCYAPEFASENDGFNKEAFELLYGLESKNFWFRARNELIVFLVQKHHPASVRTKYMEIGCGTGFVLSGLSKLKNLSLVGSEIYVQGLKLAQRRNPGVDFVQVDARAMPFYNEFDGIGAFDVLEHIKEDERVIENVYGALKPGGKFLVSVPQYQFLWSQVDVRAHHQRRYSRSELHRKLVKAGFSVVFTSSFVTALFPVMLGSRLLRRRRTSALSSELHLPSLINCLFYFFTKIDVLLVKVGLRLPFGGSLVCIAVKDVGGTSKSVKL